METLNIIIDKITHGTKEGELILFSAMFFAVFFSILIIGAVQKMKKKNLFMKIVEYFFGIIFLFFFLSFYLSGLTKGIPDRGFLPFSIIGTIILATILINPKAFFSVLNRRNMSFSNMQIKMWRWTSGFLLILLLIEAYTFVKRFGFTFN
jgi:hypothetical protein